MNTETGEVNATEISVIRQVDRTEFVKLFADGVKRFFELSPAGAKLLSYVLAVVQEAPGTDRINLHFMDYMERFPGEPKPMSKTTFFRGFTELLTKGFVAQSTVPNVYFINPKLFFNGDRARFVMEYQKSEKAKALEVRKELDEVVQKALDEKVNQVLSNDKPKRKSSKLKETTWQTTPSAPQSSKQTRSSALETDSSQDFQQMPCLKHFQM